MEPKDYQVKALDAFVRWREALDTARVAAQAAATALSDKGLAIPAAISNYPRAAWEQLAAAGGVAAAAGPYVDRTDAAGRPIPHICFKVPTGGGKTLLAAEALERLRRNVGLVLWITPTRAIYEQTKAALRNREHPYRQRLDWASGGRVKFLEKDNSFTREDIANYLCVMLLSLPAANNYRNREFLRMFRDDSRYHNTFFRERDELRGYANLLPDYPDLDRAAPEGPVKRSLFNIFKMLRPVVVLDEAHKAYGKNPNNAREFAHAVSRLDPSLILELSATPNRGISNLLVDVAGTDLKKAEMIKTPVQVVSHPTADWQHTLSESHQRLEDLAAAAQALERSTGRYIRPIAVVRVERTGNDLRDGKKIHAEDVREYLNRVLHVPAAAIRVKSSYTDELGRENLLSPYSPVRWIITKNALMEGWDCAFAYVLVMLDNTQAARAITQLVGRVIRQPGARLTHHPALDQCYVYCWNTEVSRVVTQVKNGLEQEGLSGLGGEVLAAAGPQELTTVQRREPFRGRAIFLPLVSHQAGDGWVELDYQKHILPRIDWAAIAAPDPQSSLPAPAQGERATVDVGEAPPIIYQSEDLQIDKTIAADWFARRLADVMPSAWQAGRLVSRLLDSLRAAGETDETIFDRRSYLSYALREYVKDAVAAQADQIFHDKLRRKEIRFDLEAGQPQYRMVDSYDLLVSRDEPTLQNSGQSLQLSLFTPVFRREFDSELERSFARYLDEQKALEWWHRVAARQRGDYYLRGWKQERIWPDFIAMAGSNGGKAQLLVFETKGGHLKNPDTDYKKQVLKALQNTFNCGTMTVREGPAKGTFRLVFSEAEFPAALASLAEPESAPSRAAFERLADEWERERPRGVDVAEMTAHPAYQSIIAMGEAAVPGILERLAAKPDHWFVALNAITGAAPVPPESRGRVKEMAAAWLEWGRQQGYGD